jgi:hypothetical protein
MIREFKNRRCLTTLLVTAVAVVNLSAETAWKTVDFFRLANGMRASAGGIGGNLSGDKVFAVGGGAVSRLASVATVRSGDRDAQSWNTSDIFSVSGGGTDFYFQGFGAAPSATLFASGEAYKLGSGKNWIIRRSVDDGATWTTCDYLTEWIYYPSAWDVKAAPTGDIYAVGTYGGTCCPEWRLSAFQWFIRKSSDDGRTWETVDKLGSLAPYNYSGAHAIAIAGDAIFAAGFVSLSPDWYGAEAWTVRRSLDRGETWVTVDEFQVETGHAADAEGIAVGPNGEIYVTGWATGGSGDSRIDYWIVRRSMDGGATWQTVDSLVNPSDQTMSPWDVACDPAGRVWVCGYTVQDGIQNGWLVRRGVTIQDGSIEWENSDFVTGRGSSANGIWCDREGRVFVSGRTTDSVGVAGFTTRMLSAQAAAEKPTEDPFTPPAPSVGRGQPLNLNIVRAGDALVVTWPVIVRGGILEFTDAIPAQEWKPVPTLPFSVGNENVIMLDTAARARFFRLRQR